MIEQGFRWHVQNNFYSREFYLYAMFMDARTGSRSIATNVTFETLTEGESHREPMLKMGPEEAQMLIDALWEAGVRPTNVGTAGERGALQDHIKDLRMVVTRVLPPLRGGEPS